MLFQGCAGYSFVPKGGVGYCFLKSKLDPNSLIVSETCVSGSATGYPLPATNSKLPSLLFNVTADPNGWSVGGGGGGGIKKKEKRSLAADQMRKAERFFCSLNPSSFNHRILDGL